MIVCEHETAVVILSYNGIEWHEKFLPLIIAESANNYDVIVVDNASTLDVQGYVEEHFPTVKTMRLETNNGFSHGYAVALRQIQAKYYVLLSADFAVSEGWFQPLLRAMQQVSGLAACQPKIRYWREPEKFEYAGAAGGFMDNLGYLFCRGRLFYDIEVDQNQYDDNIEVFWASGGCMMIKSELYHHVGGLDARLYAHMEEVDLCWRLKNAGYKIGYIGDSIVYHVGGSIISYGSPQKLYYNFRNNLILLFKNEKLRKLIWLLPFRLMLDGVAAIQYALKGNLSSIKTIFKAHMDFYSQIGYWYKQRKLSQSKVTVRNEAGIYKKSIVWEYFLLRRRKFSQLKWKPTPLR